MLFSSGILDVRTEKTQSIAVTDAEVRHIVRTHCSSCHSDTPTEIGISEAPKGVMFDTMSDVKKYAAQIRQQAVDTPTMPAGNPTGMTEDERKKLGAWIDSLD